MDQLEYEQRIEFAESCDTTYGYIKKMLSLSKNAEKNQEKPLYFGSKLSRKFEEKSRGFLRREELRPHDWWDHWPELGARKH